MDNVLIDFNRGLEEFNIKNDTCFIHLPRSEWTELQIKLDRAVVDCMNTPEFFRNLPIMEGSKDLWNFVLDNFNVPYVLTAYPQTCNDIPRVSREKRLSIEEHFAPDLPDNHFICCDRKEKAEYAWSGTQPSKTIGGQGWVGDSNILIDDMEANIEAWEGAGGIGILFKNTQQAIEDLKKYV